MLLTRKLTAYAFSVPRTAITPRPTLCEQFGLTRHLTVGRVTARTGNVVENIHGLGCLWRIWSCNHSSKSKSSSQQAEEHSGNTNGQIPRGYLGGCAWKSLRTCGPDGASRSSSNLRLVRWFARCSYLLGGNPASQHDNHYNCHEDPLRHIFTSFLAKI